MPLIAAVLAAGSLPAPARAQFDSTPRTQAERNEALPPVPPGVPTTPENVHLPTEGEVKLGREGAAEVEKQFKIITSGPYYDRLQRIARDVVRAMERAEIAADYRRKYRLPKAEDRSRRVPFEYTFKVVDDTRIINAFSLAGGPIYVTKGLMDYAGSDHELAGVLAHECAHVAYHHVEQLIKKQKSLSSKQLWGMLAAVIAGAAGGGGAVAAASQALMGAQLVSIAALNGYGRDLEHEADRVGVMALVGTSYNPVGALTFMQKLAKDDHLRGNPDFGIFQSHPYSNERVAAIKKLLEESGYSTDQGTQRHISGAFRIGTEPTRLQGKEAVELRLNGNTLFVVVAGEGDADPAERARRMAREMEAIFAQRFTFNDVRRGPDGSSLLLKGMPVIRVYPEDAAVLGSSKAVVERAFKEINRALWQEKLDMQF